MERRIEDMTPEELRAKLQQIIQNPSDQAALTTILTEVADRYTETYTTNQTIQKQMDDQGKQIRDLQNTNMNLFLRVQQPGPIAPDKVNNTTEPLTYDDLLKDFQ